MQVIQCRLPETLQTIEIITFADLHIADDCCDMDAIKDRVKYVKERPNVYVVLGGDLANVATTSSISDTYASRMTPMQELETLAELFEPIKDRILCILPGNHEERVYRSDGIDMMRIMAKQLDVMDKYSPTSAVVFVRFGEDAKRHRRQCYTLYVNHGSGGGRKEGGKINRLADLSCIVDADIYLHFHTHLPAIFKTAYFRVDASNSAVAQVDKLFVNGGATLQYGGYGDRQAYKPNSMASPIITLTGPRKSMRATL